MNGNARRLEKGDGTQKRARRRRVKAAGVAWRRFVTLMEALPADQARALWRDVQARAAAFSAAQNSL